MAVFPNGMCCAAPEFVGKFLANRYNGSAYLAGCVCVGVTIVAKRLNGPSWFLLRGLRQRIANLHRMGAGIRPWKGRPPAEAGCWS